jgi:hypothetical protein
MESPVPSSPVCPAEIWQVLIYSMAEGGTWSFSRKSEAGRDREAVDQEIAIQSDALQINGRNAGS